VCIALSIVAHSSTDVPVARLFDIETIVGIPARWPPRHVVRCF
jgi:sodium/hydrogen antiporter